MAGPAARMKAAREHRVPLSEPALAILSRVNEAKVSDYVFPGHRSGKPLSVMALEMVLRRMGIEDATVHGFRSAFRDWAGNETHFPRELAEHALAHVRRELMDAWARHCVGGAGDRCWRSSGQRRTV